MEMKGAIRTGAKSVVTRGVGRGRSALDTGRQRVLETGRKGIEKTQETGQQITNKAREAIEARRGQKVSETLNAVERPEDQMTVLATAEPKDLLSDPVDFIEYNAQNRLLEHEAGVNMTGQTLTEDQKAHLLQNMRASEADKFVTDYPDIAQKYANEHPLLRDALARKAEEAQRSPIVSGASGEEKKDFDEALRRTVPNGESPQPAPPTGREGEQPPDSPPPAPPAPEEPGEDAEGEEIEPAPILTPEEEEQVNEGRRAVRDELLADQGLVSEAAEAETEEQQQMLLNRTMKKVRETLTAKNMIYSTLVVLMISSLITLGLLKMGKDLEKFGR